MRNVVANLNNCSHWNEKVVTRVNQYPEAIQAVDSSCWHFIGGGRFGHKSHQHDVVLLRAE